ncbi:MAG: hypothetical protein M3M99_02145 [Actinomycetota bacterium]|nr:hypothetical protein [Actinomycetota bacterium]
MRTKLTALLAIGGCLAAVGVATAATVTVALYSFQTQADVAAFARLAGGKCARKWEGQKAMAVSVAAGKPNFCLMRTSVVGDSTDPGSDMEITANAYLGSGTPTKLKPKAFVGVATRASETAGYQLRIRPAAQVWQLFRDPRGAAGPTLYKAGKAKFIKSGATTRATADKPAKTPKPGASSNLILLQTFDNNTATTNVTAMVNGRLLLSFADTGADQPDGRRSAVSVGVKGAGSAAGVTGVFDNVAIQVPSPF